MLKENAKVKAKETSLIWCFVRRGTPMDGVYWFRYS